MIESPTPRSGANPITMDPIVAPNAVSPTASPINGHEQNVPQLDDLQYACTFKLGAAKPCADNDPACDCSGTSNPAHPTTDLSQVTTANSPLCQPIAGGAATNLQNYAKAYPGARELQVLKDFKDNAIVASICPKVTDAATSDPNYGYNPAVGAIIERLKIYLSGPCLPRAVQADPTTHQVECEVIEARPSGCDCSLPGRAPADEPGDKTIISAVEAQLQASGTCGVPGKPACSTFCECKIEQETDTDLTTCEQNGTPSKPGFCYIGDPKSPAVLHCPDNEKRILRFADSDANRIPANGAVAFIACNGATITADSGSAQ